jgi:hypothetical protein
MAYTAGRGWIEMLRIDDVEYQHVLGLRLNVWTSIALFILSAIYFFVVGRKRRGRETEVYTEKRLAAARAENLDVADASDGGLEPATATEPADTDRTSTGPPDPAG